MNKMYWTEARNRFEKSTASIQIIHNKMQANLDPTEQGV